MKNLTHGDGNQFTEKRKRMKPVFQRFKDLNKPNWDFHLHTIWTDGQASIRETLQRAKELNLEAIAITDHVRSDSLWFKDFASNIKLEAEKFDVLTLVGCETKVKDLNGTLDLNDEIINSTDIVLASVHRLPFMDNADFSKVEPELLLKTEFELSLAIINNQLTDVLAHPFGMTMRWTSLFKSNIDKFKMVVNEIIKVNKAIEINTNYMRGENLDLVLSVLNELNPLVSVGSDAHTLDRIGAVLFKE